MKKHILKCITRHVRGRPCTRSQIQVTQDRIIATACLIGSVIALAFIAVMLVLITELTFSFAR